MLMRSDKSDVNAYKLSRFSVYVLAFCALIAIIDVLMHGEFIKLLGYDSHYAGEQFRLIDSYDDTIRATGGFSDALNFGYTLAIGVFLCMECYAQRIMRKRMLILSLIMSVAVCMTLTRGAILIVFLIYFAYFVTNRTLIKTVCVLCILMIPVIAIQTTYLDKYTDLLVGRFTDSSATSKGSTQGRFDMAAKSMAYLADNPMGVGLGTQGSGNLIAQDDKRINTDNYFFWMALETGILGLILNLIYIITQFIYGLSRQLINEKIHPLRPYMVMMMAYFIASALSSAPSSSTFSLFFWCVLALLPGLKLHKGYYEKNHNGY
ncbi:O-Antigen ligase [Kosakonia arachidis]|uniref:O-Antigen ligase n=2 Tax=Kosakonia arachidis TaxID=551989 RepID=A0A1I7D151_9ENTR|nr:O-Antigen ligase [Kosakonia arachidis]